jgi:hypothetical protein
MVTAKANDGRAPQNWGLAGYSSEEICKELSFLGSQCRLYFAKKGSDAFGLSLCFVCFRQSYALLLEETLLLTVKIKNNQEPLASFLGYHHE